MERDRPRLSRVIDDSAFIPGTRLRFAGLVRERNSHPEYLLYLHSRAVGTLTVQVKTMVIFSSRVCSDPGTSRNLTTFSSLPWPDDDDPVPAPIGCRSSSGIISRSWPLPSGADAPAAAAVLAVAASTWVTWTSSFPGPLLELLPLLLLVQKGWFTWRRWQGFAGARDTEQHPAVGRGPPSTDAAESDERRREPTGAFLRAAE